MVSGLAIAIDERFLERKDIILSRDSGDFVDNTVQSQPFTYDSVKIGQRV